MLKHLLTNEYVYFYGLLIISILLIQIPLLGQFVRVFNTLIHEFGHALMALLSNGRVLHIKLKADTSGEALTENSSFFSRLLVSLSGYSFSAVAAFLVFLVYPLHYYSILFLVLGAIGILSLILWVRNSFGIFWLLFYCGGMALLLYFKNPTVMKLSCILLGGILLFENFFSCLHLLKISWSQADKAGDACNLAKTTHIPALFWAIGFCAFSIFMGYLTVTRYFPLPN